VDRFGDEAKPLALFKNPTALLLPEEGFGQSNVDAGRERDLRKSIAQLLI